MAIAKLPDYITGRRGKHFTVALRAAQKRGAVIIVEETGEPVYYDRLSDSHHLSHWIAANGVRYESRDCIPVF